MAEGTIVPQKKQFILKKFTANYDALTSGSTRRWYPVSSFSGYSTWKANTSYAVGDLVKRTLTSGSESYVEGFRCTTANSDATFTLSKWRPVMIYEWPEGYYPVGISRIRTGSQYTVLTCLVLSRNAGSNNPVFAIKNTSTNDIAGPIDASFEVLFAPEDMVEVT